MKSIEQSLNLVPIKPPTYGNPVTDRRNRLVRNINYQIELVNKFRIGEPIKKQWFWNDDEGNIYLPIKYGKNTLELGKGKFAIKCSSIDDVQRNLETVKTLTLMGNLDLILASISKNIRNKFMRE
jgi:hypothetical protein